MLLSSLSDEIILSLCPMVLSTPSLLEELVDARASSVETTNLPSLDDGRRGWLAS